MMYLSAVVSDLSWIKDLVLPLLVGMLCTYVYNHGGRLLRSRRSKAARKRTEYRINMAMIVVTADYAGGFMAILTLKVTHLIVRCTAFLFGFTSMLSFYVIMIIGKQDNYLVVLFMGILSGVMLNMVRTAWDEIHKITLAYAHPVQHVEEIVSELDPGLRTNFADALDRLRALAEQVNLQRQGRLSAELLAGRLISVNNERGD